MRHRGLPDRGADRLRIVGQEAKVGGLGPSQAGQGGAQWHPVGVEDLPRSQRLAGLDQFVACGQDRHPQASAHGHGRHAPPREQRQPRRGQREARSQRRGALGHVLAPAADVPAVMGALGEGDPVSLSGDLFLHLLASLQYRPGPGSGRR